MARSILNRIRKLERRRIKQGTNRILCYNPADRADAPTSRALPVRVVGHWRKGESPSSGPLGRFTGRFMLVPDHGSAADWERAAQLQQRNLTNSAKEKK